MPRIKRWFPVSHDINADPEVWAMRRQIGEKSLSIWLEFLSIADRNEGELPGDLEELIRLVAGRCQATKRTVRAVYQFALSRLWLASESPLRIAKYREYHKTRGTNQAPSEPSEPSEPTKDKDEEPASPALSAHSFSNNGSEQWKQVVERLYQSDKSRLKSLFAWANGIYAKGVAPGSIRDALLNFEGFEQRNGAVDDWYPYLKKILERTAVRSSIKQAELKHEAFKAEEKRWSENLRDGTMTANQLVNGIASRLEAKK